MRQIERTKFSCVKAPASVATATETATSYVDTSACLNVAFCVAAASLATGKKLKVALYAADDTSGTNAAKVAEKEFAAAADLTAPVAVIDYKPDPTKGRYVCAKFQHDSGSGVIYAVTAMQEGEYRPADNALTLVI